MRPIPVLLLALPSLALAVPTEVHHQGRLFDGLGAPLDGSHDLTLSLYDAVSGGTAIWSETHTLTFDNGYYAVTLGETTALDETLFDGGDRWFGLTVDGGAELPTRIAADSAPYALRANVADSVDGGTVNAAEVQVNGTTIIDSTGMIDISRISGTQPDTLAQLTCPGADSIAVFDGTDWTCGALADQTIAAAQLNGTIDISNLPVGIGNTDVAAGDHGHTADEVGALPASTTAADIGAMPASGGSFTGALDGTDATFTGDVTAATLDGELQQGNLALGRLCARDAYFAGGYCLPKDSASYTAKTACTNGTLNNGVCWSITGCSMTDRETAEANCTSAGGRLCTVRELDRMDGVGCGGDQTPTWAMLTNTESPSGNPWVGTCIRRASDGLAASGVTAYELDTNDQIAGCTVESVRGWNATNALPKSAYGYCCYD